MTGHAPDYTEIDGCRICGNRALARVFSLGEQALTGVFPKTRDAAVTSGPVDLVLCDRSSDPEACGLLQLKQTYSFSEMYGESYGYRSGLNASMVAHLGRRVARVREIVALQPGDTVIDIGSNDGTLLSAYGDARLTRIGVDPSGARFAQYYPPDVTIVPEFFGSDAGNAALGGRKAAVVTSIAMFYDLPSPLDFVSAVRSVLAPEGIWVFEQSYLPLMLDRTAYDTVCHEHLEYYGLHQIMWMLERSGMKAIDVELNDVNGGSFCVTAARSESAHPVSPSVAQHVTRESSLHLDRMAPYAAFAGRVERRRSELLESLAQIRSEGRTVAGYGASTKGNVVLQFSGLTPAELPFIAEVNEEKFGSFTPGTRIPIVSEAEAKRRGADSFLVLPWHFREAVLRREKEFLASGGEFLFPLPVVERVRH